MFYSDHTDRNSNLRHDNKQIKSQEVYTMVVGYDQINPKEIHNR